MQERHSGTHNGSKLLSCCHCSSERNGSTKRVAYACVASHSVSGHGKVSHRCITLHRTIREGSLIGPCFSWYHRPHCHIVGSNTRFGTSYNDAQCNAALATYFSPSNGLDLHLRFHRCITHTQRNSGSNARSQPGAERYPCGDTHPRSRCCSSLYSTVRPSGLGLINDFYWKLCFTTFFRVASVPCELRRLETFKSAPWYLCIIGRLEA